MALFVRVAGTDLGQLAPAKQEGVRSAGRRPYTGHGFRSQGCCATPWREARASASGNLGCPLVY
eukprot:scaffold289631_cov37-Tisochrysis_lutea.AAC.1